MISLIKSEFQKLLTVRSTYVILAICLLITAFFAFYIEGFRTVGNVQDPGKLASEVTSAVQALAFLLSLVGALLITHEYRYNTIMYTLTSAKSRIKVLLAKVIVVSVFAIAATLILGALSPLFTLAGQQLKGVDMVAQNIPYMDLLWRTALYGWGYSLLAIIFAFIIRSQVGTIVALIFIPGTVEALAGLLLKENVRYMPFNALSGVIGSHPVPSFTHEKAALVVLAYVAAGLIISAILFKRRDAN